MNTNNEFLCEVQDRNIKGRGGERRFMATMQFLPDRLLITCMDASILKAVTESEVYFKMLPDQLTSPTVHQISYRSIRFVMRKGRQVTISGLRKDVHFRLLAPFTSSSSDQTINMNIDMVLESIQNEDYFDDDNDGINEGYVRQVFTPISLDQQFKQFIGESSYRWLMSNSTNGYCEVKFWINNLYSGLCRPEIFDLDRHSFESWLLIFQVRQEMMERIARVIRRQISVEQQQRQGNNDRKLLHSLSCSLTCNPPSSLLPSLVSSSSLPSSPLPSSSCLSLLSSSSESSSGTTSPSY